jgi:hypothetical protein
MACRTRYLCPAGTAFIGTGLLWRPLSGRVLTKETGAVHTEIIRQPGESSKRADGFVSVNAPYAGGEMLTKTLVFRGRKLVINYSTSAVGSIEVEIQDQFGRPMEGFALADSAEIYGDEIERAVSWKYGTDMSSLAGKPIRVRFVMKDADLYSICFRP